MAHLQSIVWYFVLLILVLRIYEDFSESPGLSGLAFLLYVFDDTHGDTISWLANRHAILATVLGLLTVYTHVRCRRHNGRYFNITCIIPAVCFSMSLLAGETAVTTFAFLLSYACILDTGSRRIRAFSLFPYVIILVVWRVVYQRMGYGAYGTDGYIDPGREPGAFLTRLPQAFAVLLQGQLGILPSDLWMIEQDHIGLVVVACAFVSFVVIAWLFFSLLRYNRNAWFWCFALFAALVPNTAAPPGDRTLLFSGVAAAPLLAQLFIAFIDTLSVRFQKGSRRIVMGLPVTGIAFRKLFLAPLFLLIRSHSIDSFATLSYEAADAIPNVADLSERSLVVVNPPIVELASYLPLIRATRGQSVPKHVRWISSGGMDIRITRISDRSIRVLPSKGFLSNWSDRVFRAARFPMNRGDKVALSDMTVTITEVRLDGRPSAAEFTFREPLESNKYIWMRWDQYRCKTFAFPRIGETVILPVVDYIKLIQTK
jgi:hypothetical protein